MSFLRNRLLRRFSPLGRLADVALVGGMVLRIAQRQGWISGNQASRLGAGSQSGSMMQIALGAAALVRLVRRRPSSTRSGDFVE